MDRRIHILFVVNGLAIGGAEKKLLDLAGRLNPDAYRITVCSIGQGGPLESAFRGLGVEVLVIEKKSRADLSMIRKVARLIRERDVDLVQTTLWLADVVGAFAARLAGGVPVISWETVTHGENDILRTGRRHVILYTIAMKRVRKIVAVSDEIKQTLIERRGVPASKIETIHYGVDLDRFNASTGNVTVRRELGIPSTHLVIGSVARMEPYKGVAYLQQAAVRLCGEFPDLSFVFAGDGSLRAGLEEDVRRSGLAGRIRFLGFRDDVQSIMQAFDVFVLPSITEGLPNVILEAMASAKPVIATRVGGVPEAVIPGQTGLLVPSADAGALADAVRELIMNPSAVERMGRAGRKRAETCFSVRDEVKRFERLYGSIVNQD